MYIIGWFWDEGYDFVNANSEHVVGKTRKALVIDCDAAGSPVRSRIVKCTKTCSQLPCGERVAEIYYDQYGRLSGVRVDET